MTRAPLSRLLATNLQAFLERAFREIHGQKLSNTQPYIDFIILHLELLLSGKIMKLLVNIPGRHLKTFICSVCLPAFALGFDPTLKFMIVAYSEEIAEDIVRQIREVMESSWYKDAFRTRISDRHSRKHDFTIIGGGRVRATAVGSVTGKGGDYVIFDDAHNVDDWDNDRKKARVIDAFELLLSRRDGGTLSRMLVVGHRIAIDDLSEHIRKRGDFKCIRLPLFAPRKMRFKLGNTTWILEKDDALRPDAFPREEIKKLRQFHSGPPFWLYYQQGLGPRDDDFKIQPSNFPFLPTHYGSQPTKGVPIVLSVDPAQKTVSSSRNVLHVYAIQGRDYELIDAFAEKCSFSRLARKVEQYARRYGAWFIIIENTARGGDLIDEMKRKLPQVHILSVNPQGKKADRLRKFLPVIRAKRIRIRRLDVVEEAIDEVVAYPNSPYDDHVDALTNFLEQVPELDPGIQCPPTASSPAMAVALRSTPLIGPGQTKGIGYASRSGSALSPFTNSSPDIPRSHSEVFDFGNIKVRRYRS